MRHSGSTTRIVLFAMAMIAVFAGLSLAHNMAFVIGDMSVIPMDKLVREARGANVVFVGEQHDVKEHHEAQLAFIKALKASGAHVAVGLEMFRADRQGMLDKWVEGKMSPHDFEVVYSDYWGEPWDLYADIFNYSRAQRIPMIGLNVPKEITNKVADNGFSSLTREDLLKLPLGISCDVDKDYMEFIKKAHRAHGKSDDEFVYFCEAQLMWDKVMAWYIADYVEKNPDTTVVVLAGNTHAWKKGIPEQLKKQSGLTYKVILPWSPDMNHDMLTPEYMDFLLN